MGQHLNNQVLKQVYRLSHVKIETDKAYKSEHIMKGLAGSSVHKRTF